jgi:glycosyltransferase involved in cell wall biosynthesis
MLFSTNDEADLAGKLGVMVEDTALRERLGAAARMDVENNHTWRMNAQKVLDALQS